MKRSHAGRSRWLTAVAGILVLPLLATAPSTATENRAADPLPTWAVPPAPVPLAINTVGAAPIVSKDDYVDASMLLDGVTYAMEIRGRGNSTWGWPKKPYKIKLGSAAGLLGLPAHEEWVLLANYGDRSALRNHLALRLADMTRLAWSPSTRYVDVVLNGVSQGLYLLTDQVEQGAARVALPEGGYLLEIDRRFRASGEKGFWSEHGVPVSLKDPDELSVEQRREVKHAVRDFEDVLYGEGFADPLTGYAAHINVDSVVDWYLVEELFRNQDSNFYSSVNVTFTPGVGFAMGPVWDFDLSAGTKWRVSTGPEGWHTRRGRHWVARMFDDPAFAARVKARWAELRPTVDDLIRQVDASADVIRPSALANWPLWPTVVEELLGSVHADSFDGEVAFLRGWLAARVEWMSRAEVVFDRPSWTAREGAKVVDVPVRILGDHERPVSVHYARRSGSATPGSDFTMTDGTLVFGPGETVKTFPVTILGDRRPEAAETIRLGLRTAAGSPRLGNPARIELTIGASDQQPDALIRAAGTTRFVGDDVHNRTGRRQTLTAAGQVGRFQSFEVRVTNDGTVRSTFTVTGSRSRPAAKVRYFVGALDISRAMRAPEGWTVSLGPHQHAVVRVAVKVRRDAGAPRGTAWVKAVWRGDRRRADLVRAIVPVTPPRR